MRKAPAIGTRVSFPGDCVVGPCEGVVHAVYPTYDSDFEEGGRRSKVRPEKDWHVGVTVEKLPEKWGYPDTNKFAPCVAEMKAVR